MVVSLLRLLTSFKMNNWLFILLGLGLFLALPAKSFHRSTSTSHLFDRASACDQCRSQCDEPVYLGFLFLISAFRSCTWFMRAAVLSSMEGGWFLSFSPTLFATSRPHCHLYLHLPPSLSYPHMRTHAYAPSLSFFHHSPARKRLIPIVYNCKFHRSFLFLSLTVTSFRLLSFTFENYG